jgi:AcrR family transcriptional regulator
MRQLASRCGCTAPTIYHYFRDKPGLIATVLEARLRDFVKELNALPRPEDPVETLRSLAAAFARFGVRRPGHYQLIVMDGRDGTPESPARGELLRRFNESLEDLVKRGELREPDREMLGQGIWSLIHGFILLQTTRPDEEWESDLLERSLDSLIRGSLRAPR